MPPITVLNSHKTLFSGRPRSECDERPSALTSQLWSCVNRSQTMCNQLPSSKEVMMLKARCRLLVQSGTR